MEIYNTSTISNCIEKASELASLYNGVNKRKCYVFCEDKITLSLELEIAKKCGGGFFNIDVLTFRRYISQKTNGLKSLSKQSSVMAVRKIILQKQKKLVCFNNLKYCPNVSVTLYELISQLASAKVTYSDLEKLIDYDGEKLSGALQKKLQDVVLIYKEYVNYLKRNGYCDSNDFMSLMPDIVYNDEELKNSVVILVGFSSVTKQRFDVFKSLNDAAAKVISVIVSGQSDVYVNETYNRLLQIDGNAKTVDVDGNDAAEVIALKNGLFNPKVFKNGYKGLDTNNVTVTEYSDARAEIEAVAKDVVKQTKIGGKRYKDIAVAVGDLQSYKFQIAKVFSEYGIPYYVDKAKNLSDHPICKYVLAYIDLVRKGLAVNDVLNFVCNGMFVCDKTLSDAFKIYVKKYSLSRNSFKQPFKYSDDRYDDFENIRLTVLDVYNKMSEASNLSESVAAVKYALEKTNAALNVEEYNKKLTELGERVYFEFNENILEKVYALLDEMQVVLGNDKISLLDFKTVFLSGASATQIGAIPLFNDAVYVGECKDVKIKNADVLYAIGLNGSVPFSKSDTALLSDGDLASLDKFKIIVEPKIRVVNKREKENVCIALMSFKKQLKVSYANLGVDGKSTVKSEIISYLTKIFNIDVIKDRKLTTEIETSILNDGISGSSVYSFVSDKYLSDKSALREIAKLKSSLNKSASGCEISSFYKAAEQSGKNNLLTLADEILNARQKPEFISRARNCLNGAEISATTLEEYFSCPYSNYAKNVLKLKRVETGEMQHNEIGTMLHALSEEYSKRLNEVSSKETSDALADEIISGLYQKEEYAKYLEKPTYKYLFNKIKQEGKKVCFQIYLTYCNSKFKPYLFEAKFGNGKPIGGIKLKTKTGEYKVKGAVDRVDKFENEIRVIDYKSGGIHSDAESFYTGNHIQLYLYMNAFLNGDLTPAGAYYFQIKDEYVDADKVKGYVMDGNTVNDKNVLAATDNLIADGKNSNIVPVKFSGKGAVHKSWSKIVERSEMYSLVNYARKIAAKGVDEINEGFIKATPYDGADKCQYCEYGGLCSTSAENVTGRKVGKVTYQTIALASDADDARDDFSTIADAVIADDKTADKNLSDKNI